MKIKFACATDNGSELCKEHFGSAKYYMVYELDFETKKVLFLEKRLNETPQEKYHGDSKKAKAISSILNDVHLLLGYVFGPNIMRVRKRFVIVISREKVIKKAIQNLLQQIDKINEELKKGNDKEIIRVN